MASHNSNTLSLPPGNGRNHSLSTINSDTATFHTAHTLPLDSTEQILETFTESTPLPKTQALKMSRTDSGYEEDLMHRRSTSTTSSRRRKHRPSNNRSASTSTSHTASRRTSRSIHNNTSYTHTRTAVHDRHTTLPSSQLPHPYYEFFQFSSIVDPAEDISAAPTAPLPPPATIHYWTSEESRRLEYAAIDAASRGVRGFVTKILPDFVLPCEYRRAKFHCKDDEDDDADSDAGSVRRYRLSLPEEKTNLCPLQQLGLKDSSKSRRHGFMSKLTGFRKAMAS